MDLTKSIFLDRRIFLTGVAGAAVTMASPRGFGFGKRHEDHALLDNLSHRCFRYFWDASDPETGICRDLIHGDPVDNAKKGDEARGSTGVTGFCLTALCIGAERKWIPRDPAKDRVRRILRSYTNGKVPATNGWFYHFIDVHTGERWKDVEISTSDSIWLLAGALTCRQYFHEDHEIAELATLLYSRYDFPWMEARRLHQVSLRQVLPTCGDVSARHRIANAPTSARRMVCMGANPQHLCELQLHWHITFVDISVSLRMVRLPWPPRESRNQGGLVRELPHRNASASRGVLHRSLKRVSPIHADDLGNH